MSPTSPETFDPFAHLGLERRYSLDPALVRRAYLERSAKLHPDVAGDDPEVEDRAAKLNLARQTLEDPEQRAIALWKLLGGGNGGAAGADDRALPPGFLMEMMEIRERIESELAGGGPGARETWEEWGRQRRAAHETEVARLFDRASPGDAATLKQIKLELNAWRYIERMMQQLSDSG